MRTSDDFSSYLGDLLQGAYDCVDRISIRGYFPMGQTSGGFIMWWNLLYPGQPITEKSLRSLAGDFARRIRAFARKKDIPHSIFVFRRGRQNRHTPRMLEEP